MPPSRYRNCCWTWNNPDFLTQFDSDKMGYLVYQEEFAPTTLTYHLQGYVEFKTAMGLNAAKLLLGGSQVHLAPRMGTAEQAANYCKKEFNDDGTRKRNEGTEVCEWGTISQQGKRTDLATFKEAVLSGKRKRDLLDDHLLVFARYPKLYDVINYRRPERDTPPEVMLLIGPTGLGKSRYIYDLYKGDDELYICPLSNGTNWYDLYDGHKYALMDDFAGKASCMTLTCLLRLLDRYPVLAPTKGSHTWWYPTHIYVTTNLLPKDWYPWEKRAEQYLALERRFTRTLIFGRGEEASDAPPSWWKDNCPHDASAIYGERDGLEMPTLDIQN